MSTITDTEPQGSVNYSITRENSNRIKIIRTQTFCLWERISRVACGVLCCVPFCCYRKEFTEQYVHGPCRGTVEETKVVELTATSPAGYTPQGTIYGTKAIEFYGYGKNGKLLLDPLITQYLKSIDTKSRLFDSGSGKGPWAIEAARLGITDIHAMDIQPEMIEAARKSAVEAGVEKKITFMVADATDLLYRDNHFDHVLSFFVGCNLPSVLFLKQYFSELHRTLKGGGSAAITAPSSLEVLFTDGSKPDSEILDKLSPTLNELNLEYQNLDMDTHFEAIQECLLRFPEIFSATFTIENGKFILVSDAATLRPGQKIIRKLPDVVIPNYFYPTSLYEAYFKELGFKVEQTFQPPTRDWLESHNRQNPQDQLGAAYSQHPIYAFWNVVKKTTYTEAIV